MWELITIKQYYEMIDLIQNEKDPNLITEGLLKMLYNIDMGDIPVTQIGYYMKKLDFIKTEPKRAPLKKVYEIDGMKFKPSTDLTKITTSQFIDYQEFLKRNDYKHILNCFLIKEGESYGDNDYSEFLWDNMKFVDYQAVLFFYQDLLDRLLINTLRSSEKMLKKMYRKEKDPKKKEELLEKIVQLRLAKNEVGSQML